MTLARHNASLPHPAPAGKYRAAGAARTVADDATDAAANLAQQVGRQMPRNVAQDVAHYAAGGAPDAGKTACLHLFGRLRRFAPASWLALPAAAETDGAALDRMLAGAVGAGCAVDAANAADAASAQAYAAIAAEAGRARRHGVRDATPPALLLLASMALGQRAGQVGHDEGRGKDALGLAAAALALAQRQGGAQYERALALHAVLVSPFISPLVPPPVPSCAAPGAAPDAPGHAGTLAEAARARHAGRRLDALAGFESAGAGAGRDGQHWLAGLAWEQAALLAGDSGLAAAAQHYRRQALAGYERAGAPGRVDALRRAWGEDSAAVERAAGALQAERERILRAGSIGEIGLSIAHEVNQPLAAISLHAAAARKWLRRPQPDIERALASLLLISAAGRHAGDIVRSVQRLAARQACEMGKVPVDQTIADTLQLLRRPLRKHGIEIDLALGLGECIIQANRVQLQQVVTNLVVNAIEALSGNQGRALDAPAGDAASGHPPAARRIHVQSRRVGIDEVEISVADNGPGIAQQDRERVFGSLFSTKPNSTGMGLSISLAIVRAHGGQIDYEPGQPHGACFRFRLPVHARPQPGAAALPALQSRP
jgi:signal transduction histidine kinase